MHGAGMLFPRIFLRLGLICCRYSPEPSISCHDLCDADALPWRQLAIALVPLAIGRDLDSLILLHTSTNRAWTSRSSSG
jgi:hypothetical protein